MLNDTNYSLQIFAEKVFYYKQIVKDSQSIVNLIEQFDNDCSDASLISRWEKWYTSNEPRYLFGLKKSTNHDKYEFATTEIKNVYDILTNALNMTYSDYCTSNNIQAGKLAPISISKYFTGSYMGPHTDSSPNPTTEHISAVLYLNDDYLGGEISFPNQAVKIKPEAGSVVIFPSVPPYVHESLKVEDGVKYMVPAFWHLLK